jgi:hypothetical protein
VAQDRGGEAVEGVGSGDECGDGVLRCRRVGGQAFRTARGKRRLGVRSAGCVELFGTADGAESRGNDRGVGVTGCPCGIECHHVLNEARTEVAGCRGSGRKVESEREAGLDEVSRDAEGERSW